MYVIFNAADVVEESYLALVSQESEAPTGLAAVTQQTSAPLPPPPLPPPVPTSHPPPPPQPTRNPATPHHRYHPQSQLVNQSVNQPASAAVAPQSIHRVSSNGGTVEQALEAAPAPPPPPPPIYHDTRAEQQRAQEHIARVSQEPNHLKSLHVESEEVGGGESHLLPHPLATSRSLTQLQPGDLDDLGERFCEDNDAFYIEPDVEEDPAGIPDLVSTVYTSIYGFAKHPGALTETIVLKTMSKHPTQSGLQAGNNLGGGRGSSSAAGTSAGIDEPPPPPPPPLKFPDLIHPSQNEPLKSHQQSTFRLVKTISDFTHALSKAHEQHAEDLQNLAEDFRRKSAEFRDRTYSDRSTLWAGWDELLLETEADAACHADVAGVISRAVSRPLLEKTFHMKIQSRKVFAHRESYETILSKTEEMLLKCYDDYCMAVEVHSAQASPTTYANLVESHNDYVQQLHAANGMVDQYYAETLPLLLQELDDVYHDVSAVVAETMIQGSDAMAIKTAEVARRYESLGRVAKNINPPMDIGHFIKTLHIPESMMVSKHKYALPQLGEPLPMDKFAFLRDEVLVDRATQNSARARFDNLTKEASELDVQTRQLTESLDKLVRIQARSIESALFNKANELQEDISLKRFDQRIAHLHLAAVNAQKEMFASKVDGGGGLIGGGSGVSTNPGKMMMSSGASGSGGGGLGGGGGSVTGTPPVNNTAVDGRERKMSTSSAGSMKNKWVKAFKSIKVVGGQKDALEDQGTNNGNGNGSPAMDAHIFQEYTYKKITPCDICSQILRGHTRQGMKCKLCRMNIHPDCQDQVPKCQPKSRLLRRQRSASELESRPFDTEDDSGYLEAADGADTRRQQYLQLKSLSIDSQKSSASSRASDPSDPRYAAGGQGGMGTGPGGYPSPGGGGGRSVSFGGSYSASGVNPFKPQPKLAQVAAALLKAKREGQLPSAFGDITLPGTGLPGLPENPEGGGNGSVGAPNGSAPVPTSGPGAPPLNLNPAVKNKLMAATQQIKAQQQAQNQPNQTPRSLQSSS